MPKETKILLAKVLSEFGIKGQVKIVVFSDDPLKLEKYELVDQNNQPVKVTYTNKNKVPIKYHNGNPIMIASLNGATTRNESEAQRKTEIFIARDKMEKEDEGEYYYADLMGMDVINQENGQKIGVTTNVLDHGAGTIILVEFEQKAIKQSYLKEEYFTFNNDIFPEVDVDNNKITINLPDFAEIKSEKTPNNKA